MGFTMGSNDFLIVSQNGDVMEMQTLMIWTESSTACENSSNQCPEIDFIIFNRHFVSLNSI